MKRDAAVAALVGLAVGSGCATRQRLQLTVPAPAARVEWVEIYESGRRGPVRVQAAPAEVEVVTSGPDSTAVWVGLGGLAVGAIGFGLGVEGVRASLNDQGIGLFGLGATLLFAGGITAIAATLIGIGEAVPEPVDAIELTARVEGRGVVSSTVDLPLPTCPRVVCPPVMIRVPPGPRLDPTSAPAAKPTAPPKGPENPPDRDGVGDPVRH